jgi:hypothetical protein
MRCVVDTNVAVIANGTSAPASADCAAASARALQDVMRSGHVFIDDAGEIVTEYRNNLAPFGQPLPGNAFLKWLLTHEWDRRRVTRVTVTRNNGSTGFDELPVPDDGTRYDPSDCKFLAIAATHPEHPPILQAMDSKWFGWVKALETCGVTIHFLCRDEIERLYHRQVEP